MNTGARLLYMVGIIASVVLAVAVWGQARSDLRTLRRLDCQRATATHTFLASDLRLRQQGVAQARRYALLWRQLAQHTATQAVSEFIQQDATRLETSAVASLRAVRLWRRQLALLATCPS